MTTSIKSPTVSPASAGPYQLGWIHYWNLHPFESELLRSAGGEIELKRGAPAQVNKWLSEGKVALAPCSSICLLQNPQHEVTVPLGVSALGAVGSVYLGVPPDEPELAELIKGRQAALREICRQALKTCEGDARKTAAMIFKLAATLPPVDPALAPGLLLTPASATSAALSKVLYCLWFGEAAYQMRASGKAAAAAAGMSLKRPLELLIGDEALERRSTFRLVFDLGEVWRELTDLPFVYAVWQSSRRAAVSAPLRQLLLDAAELAQARMRVEPSHYLPDMPATDLAGKSIDLPAYWKAIQYRLTPVHFRSLALFLGLARQLDPEAYEDQTIVNLARWEAVGAASSQISF